MGKRGGARGPVKFRRTEATRLVRSALDAGLAVKGITVSPDGTIGLVVGEAGAEPQRDRDDLKKHAPGEERPS